MSEFPYSELTGVTELRIHGVSGTPVTSMLEHPHPVQVSGDGQAGFYRRGSADDPVDTPEKGPRRLEAYSWGGLTAGAGARAFWLLLLPFTLVNVASWAHPVRPRPRFAPVGTVSGLVRVIALSVTGTIVLGTAAVSMDMFAWQCGAAVRRCASRHWYTDFMSKGLWHEPGPRIVAGAVVPLLLVGVLWYLSRSTGKAYEEYSDHLDREDTTPAGTGTESCGAADFARPRFWAGGEPLRRLRALHTGAAFAMVAALAAYPARRFAHGGRHALGTALLVVAGVVIAAAVALAMSPYSGRRRALFEHRDPPRAARLAMDAVLWAGVALAVAALAYAWFWRSPAPAEGTILPGLHHTVNRLLRAQMLVWVLLFLATAWALLPYRRTAGQSLRGRPTFFGFAGPVLAGLGVCIAGLYVAGAGLRVADFLGTPAPSNCLPRCAVSQTNAVFGVPPEYYWAGTTFALAAVAAVVTLVGVMVWTRLGAKRRRSAVRDEYAVPSGDDGRVKTVAALEQKAALTDVGDVVLLWVLVPALAGTLLLWAFERRAQGHALSALTTLGTWLVGAAALAIVGLGRSAYRNDALRKTVGIIWDLATFWPRAAHPFAPPCYCERTIPELRRRISRLRDGGGDVVISAHSQGTVIAAATVLQIAPEDRARVGLVTYGSPLDRLYARAFPHYFGAESLRDVDRVLGGRWRNLYRLTDPIGGPLFPPERADQDLRFTDPAFAKEAYEFTWPRSRAHSGYPHDPRFAETITSVADSLDRPG
ncbi:MAG: hypothetical protein QOE45_174 [Frankiaceae bacterium]|jgi:hypothetical protein|nr:hypothetical protein [Frankiaceae bacterium]